MKAVRAVTGIAVPLDRADIDTDTIIPQNWLITTEREGLGVGLYSNWRYLGQTLTPNPDFVMNKACFADARIIVAGPNYGCGSSREHAVWAHLDHGIGAVIAPSFGPIFYDNALKNGLLAIRLDGAEATGLIGQLMAGPDYTMHIDLETQRVYGPDARMFSFTMDEECRRAIMQGEDDIAVTLRMSAIIDEFQRGDHDSMPWLWRTAPGA